MQTEKRECNMRVDSNTYVWGAEKITIERHFRGRENPSIDIRVVGPDGEAADAELYVWGVGKHGDRDMPKIVLIEDGVERVLVEGGSNPVAAARVAAVKALAVKPTEGGDK
jgi:hypothetical protein